MRRQRGTGALGASGLALAAVACLGSPTGRVDDGGPSDAADAAHSDGGDPDAAVDLGQPWPPAGVSLDVVASRVHDVDGDGADDLLLASAGVAADRGVFVLRGGPAGVGAAYHGRVVTTAIDPVAFEAADLGGSPARELIVMGGTDERITLLVFAAEGPTTFAAEPFRHDSALLRLVAKYPTTLVRVDDVPPLGAPDIFVGSAGDLYAAEVPALTAVAIAELEPRRVPGFNSGSFLGGRIFDVLTVDDGVGDRDLWVDFGFGVSTFPDGDLVTERSEDMDTGHGAGGSDISAIADVDEDGDLEVLSGFGGFFGICEPYPVGGGAGWTDFPPGFSGDVEAGAPLLAMRAGQLDGDPSSRVDAVVYQVDNAEPTTTRRLSVIPNLQWTVTPAPRFDSPSASALGYTLPEGFLGEVMEVGDFDGDGDDEIVVVARDGDVICLQVGVASVVLCGT